MSGSSILVFFGSRNANRLYTSHRFDDEAMKWVVVEKPPVEADEEAEAQKDL